MRARAVMDDLRSGPAAGLLVLVLLALPCAAAAQANRDREMAPIPPERPIGSEPPVRQNQTGRVPAEPRGPLDRDTTGARADADEEGRVNLDFEDVELAVVIDTIAKLTGRNFVYDDRVRGRVTIISPTPIPIDQAYKVFESVLDVKGFTTVETPGGVVKVIPIRDAKETSIDTRLGNRTPDTDRFVTRLIPLSYIDAEQISNTLKPLVSKEAALVAYQPTNTLILTDSASNIRRVLSILEAIDVETFREELALIRLQWADATVVADQLGELFGADVPGVGTTRQTTAVARARARAAAQQQPTGDTSRRGQVRIITDERTNSLVILATRSTLDDVRDFIRKLDVPVEGGGRIQVYYLQHADAEELAETLNALLGGGGGLSAGGPGAPGVPGAAAGGLSEIASSVGTVTADPATNSLVIQASPEGYQALLNVIQQLDIARPQVLVEALIMEVGLTDNSKLGFDGILRLVGSKIDVTVQDVTNGLATGMAGPIALSGGGVPGFITNLLYDTTNGGNSGGTLIQGVIQASATDNSINIISAPHLLTSDNEEAEILVGNNIPIITSRLQAPTAASDQVDTSLSTSVNVERQDIGVTLRVTPQITEGETLRLNIFQEITDLNNQIQGSVGNVNQVGPALSNRRIENTVVVADNDTVVIGGLIGDRFQNDETRVPWLGSVPVLGWLFKTREKNLTKVNLLIFLTPHIIRSPNDLERQSIAKREELRRRSQESSDENPAQSAIRSLEERYPLERMLEIERQQAQQAARERAAAAAPATVPRYLVLGGVFADPGMAQSTLTQLVDAGYDGRLVSSRTAGRVLLELRVGPYPDLATAEQTADTLRRAYSLSTQVLVQPKEGESP